MTKRIAIAILIAVGLAMALGAATVVGPMAEARRSCQVLRTFARHVHLGEWTEAQVMLQTDPEWFRIERGKVLYWNYDVTARMASAQPKFWKKLEYYLTDRQMGEKVIFQGSSRGDYARLKDGKIIFMKMP